MQEDISQQFSERLKELLGHVRGSKLDIAAAVYDLIRKEEDKAAAFGYFLKNADNIESSEEREAPAFCTAAEEQRLSRACGQLVMGILDNIMEKNQDEASFYRELWDRGIAQSVNFSDDKEKIYALYRIWTDGRIPYFQLEKGRHMSNEDFGNLTADKMKEIRKIIFILNAKFSQRTERSSLLVQILESCGTEDEKTVLMAHLLYLAEAQAEARMYHEMLEKFGER